MIGMSKRQELLNDYNIAIMCDRLKLVIDLKWNDRMIFDKIYGFMNKIQKKYYNKLLNNDLYNNLLNIARERCFD